MLSAIGLLVAIAVTISILALTANHATAATPATAPHAATGSTAQTHYLAPRQEQATPNPQTSRTTGNPAAYYSSLESAQRCIR